MKQCLFNTTCVICKKPQEVLKQIPAFLPMGPSTVQKAFSFLKATSPDLVQPCFLFQLYWFFCWLFCKHYTITVYPLWDSSSTYFCGWTWLIFWTFLLPAFSSLCWTTPFATLAVTSSAGMVPLTHLAAPSHFCLLKYLHAVLLLPGSWCRNTHVGPRTSTCLTELACLGFRLPHL